MTLRFFAYYRDPEYAGCREMTWHGAADLRQLGDQLCAKLGSPFAEEFFSPDRSALGKKIIIMINGRRAEFLQGLDTPLKEDDLVQIFPIVAGG